MKKGIIEKKIRNTVTSIEGANQTVIGTAVDEAGNVSTDRSVINMDKTPPQISAISTPTTNATGWNNTDISVSFICTDTISGVSDCPASVLVVTEGADQIINAQAFYVAGNRATASHTVSIDKTAPSLSISSPLIGTVFTEATMTINWLFGRDGVQSRSVRHFTITVRRGEATHAGRARVRRVNRC